MKKSKILKSTLIFLSTFMSLNVLSSAIARPTVPITFILMYVGYQDGLIGAEFKVPDTNTTVNAGGGLRHYDVHIAKMFEITHFDCLQSRRNGSPINGHYWRYRAGNGEIDMGDFAMTCRLAQDLVTAYGLGASERTDITYYRVDATENIPTLNILGGKVETWRRFTRNFLPR